MWTVNFLMVKLVLEKAEEPEIKLPTSTESWKKQESSGKTSISALLTIPKPLTVWITINSEKFWKRWEYQTILSASCKTCMQVRKRDNWIWNNGLVQIEKGVCQGYILSPCLFNLYEEYIMWNVGLDGVKAGIKIVKRNINNLIYTDDTTLMTKSKEDLKSLDEGERE